MRTKGLDYFRDKIVRSQVQSLLPNALRWSLLLPFLVFIISCERDKSGKLFTLISSNTTGITFENRLTPTLDNNIFEYEYFFNGGGVAAADFDNDGKTDLFFGGNQVASVLYLNKGDFKFEDITSASGINTKGWCTGISVADVNQDGWQDVYVCHAGLMRTPNQLFINQGKQKDNSIKFEDQAKEYGLDYTGFSTHAAFFDYDKDGDLDMYLLNHYQANSNLNFPKNKISDGSDPSTDRLFRNDKDGSGKIRFKDVSKEAGITMEGFGLGIAIHDINEDGWDDVYVTNDFIFDDLLYINNHDGTFTERAHKYLKHTSRFSMGCDVADYNNDSYPDIVVVDMLPDDNRRQKLMNPATNEDLFNFSLKQGYLPQYTRNMLQLNNGPDAEGNISFSEIAQLAGVYKTDWSWSPLLVDFDNDGWKDLFISNGIPKDVTNHDFLKYKHVQNKQYSDPKALRKELLTQLEQMESIDKPDFAFQNNKDLTFKDVSNEWGLDTKGFSNGVCYADLDNDGDLEIITNNINAQPFIYKNNTRENTGNNYLRLKLIGKFANGARVKITTNGKEQYNSLHLQRGFQSSQENFLHFGIGEENKIDTLEIIWTDGKKQVITKPEINKLITLNYQDAKEKVNDFTFGKASKTTQTLFYETTKLLNIDFIHQENGVEDFNFESLLPHRFSRNGPYMSSGDVDGNGFEDFWIGGAAGINGKIFLQQPDKSFLSMNLPDPGFEDMGGLLFDADGDKDVDLYVVSGGNEYNEKQGQYLDRLYLNDGKGRFSRSESAIPNENISGSCVVGSDFDKDGDIDLFVGGRLKNLRYPYPASSLILINNGKGQFTNGGNEIMPDLKDIGLVTSALWKDFDNDGWEDLILAGEWMPVLLYNNVNGKLKKFDDTGLEDQVGLWFSLASGDFDKDGDLDFIGGNLGMNSKLRASKKEPVSIYAKDFLANGKMSSILTCYLGGKEYTVATRDQIGEQIPAIRGKFKTYQDFGLATFNDVFTEEELKEVYKLSAINFSSCYIENIGKGKFTIHPLPLRAQISSIQSILVDDYDNDGNLDLLLGGNFYSPDFMTGRYDASVGLLLKGNGKGEFQTVQTPQSGINFKGDVRSLLQIMVGSNKTIIAAPNLEKLQLYERRSSKIQ